MARFLVEMTKKVRARDIAKGRAEGLASAQAGRHGQGVAGPVDTPSS